MTTKYKGRFRVVVLQLGSVYPLLIEGTSYKVEMGLPPGANLYYKAYDRTKGALYLMYSHPSFEEIPANSPLPVQEIYIRSLDT